MVGIGSPPDKVAGLHFHVFNVSITDSLSEGLGDFRILMFSIVPSTVTFASASTVPWKSEVVPPSVIGGFGV